MHRTPPGDDQQQAEYTPHTTYPRQRRRRVVVPRQPDLRYRTDEKPEIPKIKRASLYSTQQKAEPVLNSEEEIDEDEHELDRQAYHPPSQKIVLTQQRRTPVYEPPAARTRYIRTQRSPSRLSRLARHPLMLITTTSLLAVLVITSIVVYAVRAQTHSTGQPTGITLSGLPPTADPHELIITPQDSDHPAPAVFATAAYLLDADTGATLYAHNPFMHLSMLSTTTLMTAVLAVEQGNPDQQITITPVIDHDLSQLSPGSVLFGIKKGETYTLRDLLYGLLLLSGNDVSIAIADTIGGNLPHFVAEMNQRAQQLGLYDTHYMNPHGLLETGQFSSAHDLAILGRYSMSLPLLHQISGTEQYHIPQSKQHPEHFVINGNQFMWWYPGVDGGKTGNVTGNYVQVISCTRNHHHLIGVVIHTVDWWTDMRDLMNWGFDSFKWISPYDVDFQHPIPFDYLWNYFTGDKKENAIPTADHGRYYIYTGFSISGLIMAYFDKGGGLKKFGYPESMPSISSTLVTSQKFDHGTIQCDLTTKTCSTV